MSKFQSTIDRIRSESLNESLSFLKKPSTAKAKSESYNGKTEAGDAEIETPKTEKVKQVAQPTAPVKAVNYGTKDTAGKQQIDKPKAEKVKQAGEPSAPVKAKNYGKDSAGKQEIKKPSTEKDGNPNYKVKILKDLKKLDKLVEEKNCLVKVSCVKCEDDDVTHECEHEFHVCHNHLDNVDDAYDVMGHVNGDEDDAVCKFCKEEGINSPVENENEIEETEWENEGEYYNESKETEETSSVGDFEVTLFVVLDDENEDKVLGYELEIKKDDLTYAIVSEKEIEMPTSEDDIIKMLDEEYATNENKVAVLSKLLGMDSESENEEELPEVESDEELPEVESEESEEKLPEIEE